MGSKCHSCQRQFPHESGPHDTANISLAYMEMTCPPCVRLLGLWKTMIHVMTHKKRAQIGHVISVILMFLARQL